MFAWRCEPPPPLLLAAAGRRRRRRSSPRLCARAAAATRQALTSLHPAPPPLLPCASPRRLVIKQLEKWGLAWNIKLPSEKQKERLRIPRTYEVAEGY